MELAIGKFPFSIEADEEEEAAGPQGILDLLQQIVLEPAPKLPKSDAFPEILEVVIAKCLMKNPEERPTPQELFDTDPFLQAAKRTPVDLEQWAVSMMERHNRKSHLAPQLSPATKALLRGEDKPSPSSSATDRTPTSGDIPISSASSNGSANSASSRPQYPARTSSASQVPAYSQPQMSLPIRPAPPPGGPLPRAPQKSGRPYTAESGDRDDYRRSTTRGGYASNENARPYRRAEEHYQ